MKGFSDVAAAREKHNLLVKELNSVNNDIRSASDTLERMETGFGPNAEWKKLDGTCVDKISGEWVDICECTGFALIGISYTYELCFFGRATQKSNKDTSSNNLGWAHYPTLCSELTIERSFIDWNTSAPPGTLDYYTRQNYRNGLAQALSLELLC